MRFYAQVRCEFPMGSSETLLFGPAFFPRSGGLRKLVENLGAVKLERLLEL